MLQNIDEIANRQVFWRISVARGKVFVIRQPVRTYFFEAMKGRRLTQPGFRSAGKSAFKPQRGDGSFILKPFRSCPICAPSSIWSIYRRQPDHRFRAAIDIRTRSDDASMFLRITHRADLYRLAHLAEIFQDVAQDEWSRDRLEVGQSFLGPSRAGPASTNPLR